MTFQEFFVLVWVAVLISAFIYCLYLRYGKGKKPKVSKEISSYHVVPSGKLWAVHKGGSSRASFLVRDKDKAIRLGNRLAKSNKCSLFIHAKDGRISKLIKYKKES